MADIQNPFALHAKKTRQDPKMIGLWKVGRTLGKGFSGHVRIARHSKTGQYAAIKIIPKNALGSRVSLNRLADEVEHNLLAVEREIVVMKLIDHPNIMKIYDVWETSSSLYLILEYVQGGELFDYLCNKGRRPTAEVVNYFQQIICAVDHCHRYNIAHRDLKLENILIDQDSNIKVADFGMATWQGDSRAKLLRTSCGSPHYAAPEIISGKPYNGSASDIWSCGIILYALLAAKLPFDDDDCPTLLRKISIGYFEMPHDIDRRAQDLISRMLTTDVDKRITMPEIMRHPFFLSYPLKNPKAMPSDPDMDLIAKPIGSLSTIDPDIFANLRTLWHGTPDSRIIERLMSSERNWEKGIYHLLVAYRKKYLANRQQELEEAQSQANSMDHRSMRRRDRAFLASALPPRDAPATSRSDKHPDGFTSSSNESLRCSPFPSISLSAPSPEKKRLRSNNMDLPKLDVPELEDEKMQAFFQQVANHLNVLNEKTSGTEARQGPSTNLFSERLAPVPHIPLNIPTSLLKPEDHLEELGALSRTILQETTRDPKGNTKPLTLRRKNRMPLQPIITIDTDGKENVIPITESVIMHGQSPLTLHTGTMEDQHYSENTKTPTNAKPLKLKKRRPSPAPVSPLFSEAGSSFSLPSSVGNAARRSWFDNVFKFKPATYSLLSRYDVHTTQSECRRLLMDMNMLVSLEDSDKLGVLKCRSHDVKDANNIMLGLKSVKFRVEMQWPTPQLCHEGYLVSLLLVQEKGSLEAFKAIYHELVETWTLGYSDRSPRLGYRTPSPTNAVGGSLNHR
ncbi:Serine/threonine-protein kinase GIN4 [Psilocybe cubensis]|uniref:non-specific serine/threonine protein kinase n=2 Tax=Psilocybe cubensis TaxID=181762 RepID=A0A8H8CJ14_PSICU|nr:Serine/threonine-protein kinase GIN4 [Psilocybe cubensis]KAH9479554.1 Serine/threonine-protein kinase GIN4 [Psilocybe cubensis]